MKTSFFRHALIALLKLMSASLALLALLVLTISLAGNVHEVDPGRLYRSGQLRGVQLQQLVEKHGIKSVLNLRGSGQGHSWYDEEITVSKRANLLHIDFELSARREVTSDQMNELAKILRDAPKPLLVHCSAGADRTGLVAAMYELQRGQPQEIAAQQLSILYGHFPWLGSGTVAMDKSLLTYATLHPTDRIPNADSR